MSVDFTFDVYETLLEAALEHGYRTMPVREYVTSESRPDGFVVVRHDVDRKPGNALRMAELEADLGVSSSYYFRAIDKTFEPDLFSRIEDMGHEVGYHYEDLDRADGDLDAAVKSFRDNLQRFRRHVDVDTVSMHGNPLTPHDNRDLWEATDLEDHGLVGEVYLTVDFTDVVYFSDTNRTWYEEKTIVNDWPVGRSEKPVQTDSTGDLIDLVESGRLPRLYFLVHPNRWADSYGEWVGEYAKDWVTNVGKWGLWATRSVRGKLPERARQ